MPITLNGDSGITTPTYGGAVAAEYIAPVTAFKNRIINGAMMIDQRNAGASVSFPTTAANYTVDRWYGYNSVPSKFTVQQNAGSVTPPAGFTSYLGVTSTSAYSVLAADAFIIVQAIEGFNVADLNWGSANASTVTLSFQVRSSLTGTFGGSIQNSGSTRSYPFSYSIPAANTWTTISITIAGDTSGTWLTTNGIGVSVVFGMGVGSTGSGTANTWQAGNLIAPTGATSVVGTSGATFYITGVQLEKGSTATSFDYRPYGTELALAQRYFAVAFCALDSSNAIASPTNYSYSYALKTTMRTQPTLAVTVLGSVNTTSVNADQFPSTQSDSFRFRVLSGGSAGATSANASVTCSSEL
jgi:hypothetical protein